MGEKFLETRTGRKKYLKYESKLIEETKFWATSHPERLASNDEDVCEIMNAFDTTLIHTYARACAAAVAKKEIEKRRPMDDMLEETFSRHYSEYGRMEVR